MTKHQTYNTDDQAALTADRTTLSLLVAGSLMAGLYLLTLGRSNFNISTSVYQLALQTLALVFYWSYRYYRHRLRSRHLVIVVAFSLFFCLLVIWMAPLSTDLYYYVFYAKIFNDYGANPYATYLNNFPNDNFFEIIPKGWSTLRLPYGPLWLLIYAPVQAIAGEHIFTNLILFKLLAIGAFLAGGALLYFLLRQRAGPGLAYPLLLYFWNPLLISEIAKDGHHDSWVALLLLLALFCYYKGWRWLVLMPVLLASFFKFVPAILLPIVYLFLVRQEPNWRRRATFTVGALILPLGALYGSLKLLVPMPTVLSLFGQARLVYASIFSYALVPYSPHSALPIHDPRLIGWSLGFFAAAYVLVAICARGGLLDLAKAIAYALLAYLMFGAFWVMPWYFVWVIPLLLLLPAPYPKLAVYISLIAFLSYYLFNQVEVGFAIALPLVVVLAPIAWFVKRVTHLDLWKYV
ncbi:MAG: hypothetical protein A3J59_03615 [Candidatus Buchananbacteria bacterium RIFCSPHIGHO2_02_FULL_56_16]|uniref:DUF2029 domain-containing protein n=1 Tax=Candidatus Buchananbacteria bacterium RIFCSPHIGHO2_02_FULL_56_16 TaxID=1797542 RepID=A0A1G1YHD8_9BACT|nr:MAG: hypothetical protein A3J59_03615 [Candidatus Buchananbacteria bacterium RIFCSPHIGHO2_02_FULL_56_16]